MNNRVNYSSLVFGFVAGGLAGASVALLLAPQSGEATREAMRNTFRETADSARGLKDRIVQRGEEIRDETAHRLSGAASALAGHGAGNGADKVASV